MQASNATDAATAADCRLPAELGIEQAAPLKAQLSGLLDRPSTVTLDAADIQRVHAAALQLFCLFCQDRRSAGRAVEFIRPSAALRSAAALLGASTLLQIARQS